MLLMAKHYFSIKDNSVKTMEDIRGFIQSHGNQYSEDDHDYLRKYLKCPNKLSTNAFR